MKQFFKKVARWWDDLFPAAKAIRKGIEQLGHALMAGIPAFLCVNWLPLPMPALIGIAVVVALILGGAREYFQNAGDQPKEDDWFLIARVPINLDLILDMTAYAVGGLVAGVLAGAL